MSPNTGMSEDDRRELIARQHRALYGAESSIYPNEPATSHSLLSQDARVTAGTVSGGLRNGSPLAYDPYALPSGPGAVTESAVTMPVRDGKDGASGNSRSRANSTSSPSSNPNGSYNLYDGPQQSSRTSASSPGGSPPLNAKPSSSGANVAPIGTRPTTSQQTGGPAPSGIQKRSTTPLPSPLSYGFSAEQGQTEKNPTQDEKMNNIRGGWGNSGVWGRKGSLGVQAKVWG
jgi:hypothetical protein